MTDIRLNTALRDALSISKDTKLTLNIKRSVCEEHNLLISVAFDEVKKEFIGVKCTGHSSVKQSKENKDESVLLPVFLFEDDDEARYVIFERDSWKNYNAASRNNLDHLEIILETLAKYQARVIAARSQNIYQQDKFEIKKLFNKVISTGFFKNYDEIGLTRELSRLERELTVLLEGNLLVRSISTSLSNNVYVDAKNKKSIFLDLSINQLMPPVYDALVFVFTLSDEEFRKNYFKRLIQNYFIALLISLEQLDKNLRQDITTEYKEATVRFLLTVVKFQLITVSNVSEDLVSNTLKFLKYPLINQEDVYEAIENKLKSTDYELIDYQMTGLSEINGHAGEYYYLDVSIMVNGEKQEIELFAKLLIPPSEAIKQILNSGPADNEDFFYSTLTPLYKKYGLDKLLDFSASCYLSRTRWLLVLTNMTKQGFGNEKMNLNLDYNGLEALISAYAKFTASTLIVEEKMSLDQGRKVRMDELYPDLFKEMIFLRETGALTELFETTVEAIPHVLDLCPEITKNYGLSRQEIVTRTKKMTKSVYDKLSKSENFRNCITHGDMYLGNMLFRHGKDGSIDKAILIDFQVMRYIPPSYDLVFFIFSNSSRELRLNHMNQLIEKYYNDVSTYLTEFGFDPESVLPKESFYQSIAYLRSAVMSVSFFYRSLTKIDPKKREEIFRDGENVNAFYSSNKEKFIDLMWSDDIYRSTMHDCVRDIMDYISSNVESQ